MFLFWAEECWKSSKNQCPTEGIKHNNFEYIFPHTRRLNSSSWLYLTTSLATLVPRFLIFVAFYLLEYVSIKRLNTYLSMFLQSSLPRQTRSMSFCYKIWIMILSFLVGDRRIAFLLWKCMVKWLGKQPLSNAVVCLMHYFLLLYFLL